MGHFRISIGSSRQQRLQLPNDRDDRAATGRATIPLDLNAASVHPIVTIPWALAIARRATPPRLASRPSHLAPSVGQPAPRRTILFPCRRALPGDRRHRGFHPAEALPRERTGHHRRPGLPRDGTSCFHHAERRPATEPSWLEAGRSADRNDRDDRAATGRATIPLDLNAASVHPIVTIPWALAIAPRATPPRLAPRPSHLAPSVGQPAPRRTILFPCRRALPGDRRHRGFHPAEALPRERTGHHRRPGLPRDGTSCFHHADRRPATEPSWLEAGLSADRNDRDDRAATGRATIPLDLNAASVHPIVTIPWALAIAPRATPPRLAPRPSHLAPSVGQPAPRRTILFPCRRALPSDRRHRGFHPAEALPRERTGHHRRPGLPRDGTSCFHHAERRPATEPSWLEAGLSADRNDQDQAAGTGRRNHWQPTLPPLACILWFCFSSKRFFHHDVHSVTGRLSGTRVRHVARCWVKWPYPLMLPIISNSHLMLHLTGLHSVVGGKPRRFAVPTGIAPISPKTTTVVLGAISSRYASFERRWRSGKQHRGHLGKHFLDLGELQLIASWSDEACSIYRNRILLVDRLGDGLLASRSLHLC